MSLQQATSQWSRGKYPQIIADLNPIRESQNRRVSTAASEALRWRVEPCSEQRGGAGRGQRTAHQHNAHNHLQCMEIPPDTCSRSFTGEKPVVSHSESSSVPSNPKRLLVHIPWGQPSVFGQFLFPSNSKFLFCFVFWSRKHSKVKKRHTYNHRACISNVSSGNSAYTRDVSQYKSACRRCSTVARRRIKAQKHEKFSVCPKVCQSALIHSEE